jgi:hypothetical protein
VVLWHHGFQLVSIAVVDRSAAAARRDSSVDVSSSQSNQRGFRIVGEGMRWGEANRSLWPNSEFHEESLPAMPVLLLSRVQNNYITCAARFAMWNSRRHSHGLGSVRKRTERSVDGQVDGILSFAVFDSEEVSVAIDLAA